MSELLIDGCSVATMDEERREIDTGYVLVRGDRIAGVGEGPAPGYEGVQRVDGRGCLLTPGLVDTHNHLYQWATRGHAVDATLFEWLVTLYPVWAGLDEDVVRVAASGALARLALTGCTSASDHHYLFPTDGGDLLAAEIEAARSVGLRFHPTRGSMDLGRSQGGLPPDEVVEDRDRILSATEAAIDRFHDPAPDSMLRVGVAPCSPFSVTAELMGEAAELARRRGVRLHTHLAETADEDAFCRERFGCSPLTYVERLGWSGSDVWYAHGIHFDDDEVRRIGADGTGIAHCPTSNGRLGAGVARAADLRAAGAPVGLGVDGAASNEAGNLVEQARQALLTARATHGPTSLAVRDVLEMATLGGACVLGRGDEIGSVQPGRLADLALWRLDTLAHAGIDDPVTALVLGSEPPLELLLVGGRPVVEKGRLVTVDEDTLAAEQRRVRRRLLDRASSVTRSVP
jgi:cytosine/adenosine deaminase-related metal-dependent hydrolase